MSLIEPRRAAVALVIRVVPPANYPLPPSGQTPVQTISIQDFFDLDWVNASGARPEILYLRRMKGDPSHATNGTGNGISKEKMNGSANGHVKVLGQKKPTESHVAFPGGRMEAEDEDGLYTGTFLE
jgi:hypothetical protein